MTESYNNLSENFDLSPLVDSVIEEAKNKFGLFAELSVHVEMNDDMQLSVTVFPEGKGSQLPQ